MLLHYQFLSVDVRVYVYVYIYIYVYKMNKCILKQQGCAQGLQCVNGSDFNADAGVENPSKNVVLFSEYAETRDYIVTVCSDV